MSPLDLPTEVLAAADRIRPFVRQTPLELSKWLSDATGATVHLKMENLQHTGSFKFRGAMNRLLTLDPEQRARGVVAASTGNHGAATAKGAAALGCPAVIFAPTTAQPGKLGAIRDHGVEVRCEGEDCLVAEAAARAFAAREGLAYVSPYNDPMIVAGQGTIGVELAGQMEAIDAAVLSVGGGGLISGAGGYLKARFPEVRIFGASPRNSAVMHHSIEAGEVLDLPSLPTLSDGTAGGVEADSITFEMCRDTIDEFVLVEEEAIASALRGAVARHHTMIEGAAATAIAALLQLGDRLAGQQVAVVLCGANIDPAVLKKVL